MLLGRNGAVRVVLLGDGIVGVVLLGWLRWLRCCWSGWNVRVFGLLLRWMGCSSDVVWVLLGWLVGGIVGVLLGWLAGSFVGVVGWGCCWGGWSSVGVLLGLLVGSFVGVVGWGVVGVLLRWLVGGVVGVGGVVLGCCWGCWNGFLGFFDDDEASMVGFRWWLCDSAFVLLVFQNKLFFSNWSML